jgi:hypothetical protein
MTDYIKEKRDEIEGIHKTFDQNILQIEQCLENGLKEASIIFIVSVFETFLRDVFILCKPMWFAYPIQEVSAMETIRKKRRQIYEYLDKINAFDDFIKIRYIYAYGEFGSPVANVFSPSDTAPLHEVLFENKKGREKINFQNLKKDYGVNVAYKTFFDIDLTTLLDKDSSSSHRMWEKLNKLFDERHEIVHKGKKTEFSKEDIRTVLDSIKYLKDSLDKRLIQRMSLE